MTGISRTEKAMVGALIATMLAFIVATFTTSDRWMRLNALEIPDGCAGRALPIVYDREFRRDFYGRWAVSVWHLERGQWVAWSGADGGFDYKVAIPPRHRDLEWLVDGDTRASRLPVGTWRVGVTITANPGTIFARTATVESNTFEVRACSS